MSRVEEVSRLVIALNNAIPEGQELLTILMALNKLESQILELLYEDALEETMAQYDEEEINNE